MEHSQKIQLTGSRRPFRTGNIQHFIDFIKQISLIGKRAKNNFRSQMLLLLLAPLLARAGFEEPILPTRVMTGAGIAEPSGSFLLNPACLPSICRMQMTSSYSRPFGLRELQRAGLEWTVVPGRIAGALAMNTRGFADYRENDFFLGISAPAVKGVRAGMRLHYAQLSIARYGSAGAVILDAGLQSPIFPELNWGWAINNLLHGRIGRCREPLPQTMQTGISLHHLRNLTICFDVFKDIRFPIDLRGNLEWQAIESLRLRAGFCTSPFRLGFGFGMQFKSLFWDYGFLTHEYLGWTHQCSLTIRLKK